MNHKYIVGAIVAAVLVLIPTTAFATSTNLCVGKSQLVSVTTPLTLGGCLSEYTLTTFGEVGPEGKEGPKGATGPEGKEGPAGGGVIKRIRLTEAVTVAAKSESGSIALNQHEWTQSGTEMVALYERAESNECLSIRWRLDGEGMPSSILDTGSSQTHKVTATIFNSCNHEETITVANAGGWDVVAFT